MQQNATYKRAIKKKQKVDEKKNSFNKNFLNEGY